MESIYAKLALYGSKTECAMTDTVFLPISEVCNGKVSLIENYILQKIHIQKGKYKNTYITNYI